jgi:hypothetical protein
MLFLPILLAYHRLSPSTLRFPYLHLIHRVGKWPVHLPGLRTTRLAIQRTGLRTVGPTIHFTPSRSTFHVTVRLSGRTVAPSGSSRFALLIALHPIVRTCFRPYRRSIRQPPSRTIRSPYLRTTRSASAPVSVRPARLAPQCASLRATPGQPSFAPQGRPRRTLVQLPPAQSL